MKYYIIAGEPSGDLHGSNLMKGLRHFDGDADFRFWGGDLMAAQGGTMVKHYKETAFMGVWDVLVNLGKIQKNFKLCYADLLANRPDVLILIDYPGFNLRVARFAHRHGIKVFYYISPKVWASKKRRVYQIKKYVDELYTILPFETEWFRSYGIEPRYCGNPVLDAIHSRPNPNESFDGFIARNGLDGRPKVALLAGSRKSEIGYVLPEMLRMVERFPQYQFVVAGAPSFTAADYQPFLGGKDVALVFNQTYELVQQARAALVTSGTATLETALLKCPQVVVYLMWGGRFTDFMAKKVFIKVPYISLVNLILGREAVQELFQSSYSVERMAQNLTALLADSPERAQMLADYNELDNIMGQQGSSMRAAQWMTDSLNQQKHI